MVVMRSNFRAYERQFPDVLGHNRTSIPASLVQLLVTGRADVGIVVLHLGDLLRGRIRALVMRMARLGASFASTRHTRNAWRRGGRVGGRWFGGVLGVLVEPGFQFGNARLEEQVLLLKLGKLLLLEGQDMQEHTDELTDCQWCGRPVVRENPIGWCQVVHAASMPRDTMAVKSRRSGDLYKTS